jgi:hypothetical protein
MTTHVVKAVPTISKMQVSKTIPCCAKRPSLRVVAVKHGPDSTSRDNDLLSFNETTLCLLLESRYACLEVLGNQSPLQGRWRIISETDYCGAN